ncbi:MAG: helix-hairpin-helix domain-containing protein [Saprospiraceae bacterium]|nr:helix-hairpin-helix domain-containing protein [Saprospiraceae bacterium]
MNPPSKHKFYLSKTEMSGIQALILCCTLYVATPIMTRMYINKYRTEQYPDSINFGITESDSSIKWKPQIDHQQLNKYKTERVDYVRFRFNPNQLTSENATKLGIPKKAYTNLQKYLNKGGIIKTSEQFKNIYGMDSMVYERLKSMIHIQPPKEKVLSKHPKIKQQLTYDLNAINVKELIYKLNLEYKLAYRIINYRTALGGYYELKQIQEVFGMHDSIYARIESRLYLQIPHQRISIQTAPLDTLAKHPYLKYKNAKLIFKYREQHGVIKDIKDLQHIIKDSLQLHKLSRYFYCQGP